jgi:uncharacterized membrane protein
MQTLESMQSAATSQFQNSMSNPSAFQISLLVSAFFVTVVFGFVLIFSIVIMPGISALKDIEYLHAFQVIDRVIQDNQPVFVVFWIATVPAILTSLGLGIRGCENPFQMSVLVLATLAILIAQSVTVTINIPRNNRLQALDFHNLDSFTAKGERDHFESVWRRSNTFRTWLFAFSSVVLMVLLLIVEP